ncbi:hypothetical protein HK104_000313 [Borealophlyctis nickersoniae]|nr:hypothetical protein HK104_000313 [Borealophlyctis nickersoniae]
MVMNLVFVSITVLLLLAGLGASLFVFLRGTEQDRRFRNVMIVISVLIVLLAIDFSFAIRCNQKLKSIEETEFVEEVGEVDVSREDEPRSRFQRAPGGRIRAPRPPPSDAGTDVKQEHAASQLVFQGWDHRVSEEMTRSLQRDQRLSRGGTMGGFAEDPSQYFGSQYSGAPSAAISPTQPLSAAGSAPGTVLGGPDGNMYGYYPNVPTQNPPETIWMNSAPPATRLEMPVTGPGPGLGWWPGPQPESDVETEISGPSYARQSFAMSGRTSMVTADHFFTPQPDDDEYQDQDRDPAELSDSVQPPDTSQSEFDSDSNVTNDSLTPRAEGMAFRKGDGFGDESFGGAGQPTFLVHQPPGAYSGGRR